MKHIVYVYKGSELVTEKPFKSWDEAKMYLEECDKLSSEYTAWYKRTKA